jgi:hypothetical protein
LINSVTHYYCSSIGRDAATQSSSTTTYGGSAPVLLRHELSDKEMCVVCTIDRMRLKQTRRKEMVLSERQEAVESIYRYDSVWVVVI